MPKRKKEIGSPWLRGEEVGKTLDGSGMWGTPGIWESVSSNARNSEPEGVQGWAGHETNHRPRRPQENFP